MQKVRKRDKEEGERRGLGLRPWEEGGKKWVWWDGPWGGGAKGGGLVDQGWEVGEIRRPWLLPPAPGREKLDPSLHTSAPTSSESLPEPRHGLGK